MNLITELNETDFPEILFAAHTAVVLDFYAPWCGPCKMRVRGAAFVPAEIAWQHLYDGALVIDVRLPEEFYRRQVTDFASISPTNMNAPVPKLAS